MYIICCKINIWIKIFVNSRTVSNFSNHYKWWWQDEEIALTIWGMIFWGMNDYRCRWVHGNHPTGLFSYSAPSVASGVHFESVFARTNSFAFSNLSFLVPHFFIFCRFKLIFFSYFIPINYSLLSTHRQASTLPPPLRRMEAGSILRFVTSHKNAKSPLSRKCYSLAENG